MQLLSVTTVNCRCATVVIALSLIISSCATPDAVRDFAKSARDVTAQFSPFVQDIAGSCIRRKLADRKVTEIEDESGPATAACREDSDLAPDLLGSMDVLTKYLNALYRLASNETVQYDTEIDSFAGKIQASAKLPAPATEAVRGLAKFLADAAASRYQRKKLAEAVKAADRHVAALTSALGRIVGVEYFRDLRNEEASLLSRYSNAMRAVDHNDGVALLLQLQWRRDFETLQKRKSAALAYQKALEKIRDSHKQLAEKSTQWSASELAKELGSYTASIQSLASSFSAASF